jgi:hypothetical protein
MTRSRGSPAGQQADRGWRVAARRGGGPVLRDCRPLVFERRCVANVFAQHCMAVGGVLHSGRLRTALRGHRVRAALRGGRPRAAWHDGRLRASLCGCCLRIARRDGRLHAASGGHRLCVTRGLSLCRCRLHVLVGVASWRLQAREGRDVRRGKKSENESKKYLSGSFGACKAGTRLYVSQWARVHGT